MNNIWLIFKNSLKLLFSKKINIFTYILLPILSTFLIIVVFGSGDSTKLTMGVVNNDKSDLSDDMIDYLEETEIFKKKVITEDEIEDKVINGEVTFVLSIGENFEETILNGQKTNVEIISIKGKDATIWVENYVNYYIRNLKDIEIATEGDKNDFYSIYENQKDGDLKFSAEKLKDQYTDKTVGRQGIGFFIMFILYGAANTANLILKERRERTYQRICTAPVTAKEYILGNMLVNLFIIIIQISSVMLLINLMGINIFIRGIDLFIVLVLFGLCAIGLGMIIMAFSKSSAESGNLSTLLIVPTCMLGGCFWEVEVMPNSVQRISDFMPQRWAIDALDKLQQGKSFYDIKLNLLVLLVFALVFFAITASKMKNTEKTSSFM
ncbi:ABC transporter permease [Clostridium sp. DL1XJH146]